MADQAAVQATLRGKLEEQEVLSVRETAALLRKGIGPTYAALKAGELPCIRIGDRFLVPKRALLRLLENPPPPEAGDGATAKREPGSPA
jgi:excisionase family DNA binding protein